MIHSIQYTGAHTLEYGFINKKALCTHKNPGVVNIFMYYINIMQKCISYFVKNIQMY